MTNKNLNRSTTHVRRTTSRHHSLAKQIRAVMEAEAETKVNSLITVANTVSNVGTVFNISNNIVEGDDVFNRAGTKVALKEIRLYYRCFAVVSSQTFRFILFHDNFNQGTTTTAAELLPALSYISQFSDVRQLQQKRFTIVDDWHADSNLNSDLIISHVRNIKTHKSIFYNGATAVAASNGAGALMLLVIGSSSTGTFDFRVQMLFNDS